jgi:hypothetical protein
MLCSHHHHRAHDDGWGITIRNGRSWFIPPAHVDTERRPRAGNVASQHLTAPLRPDRTTARAAPIDRERSGERAPVSRLAG